MKKLEKLREKSLNTAALGQIKAGGEECTGGGFSTQYNWTTCTAYTFSWQSDTVDNGIYVFQGGKTSIKPVTCIY
ncbi:hypothetical protein ATE47_01740 [Chryseobacterium sp. IHB B 17019]|jgi:hypothetical protein|uniref:hypothetical protein n=1 Tax=Chryseobacterium sp. IHB B 17019 TaxID=1721091 RepID=UPI00072199D7|nr:hypothetical protein [Chryseobacterium sp. IHB B 17019]ALR29333.1 hypothetical protein ATE47_01740 [Chryseobacterium sp. IHB B 17019]